MCANREEPARQYVVGVRDYKKGVVGIDNGKLAKSVIRVKPGAEIAKNVATDPNGIGFEATVYLPVKGAKVIQLDGITPSRETVADGSYAAIRHLYVVTKGYPSGRTKSTSTSLEARKARICSRQGVSSSNCNKHSRTTAMRGTGKCLL